jgi:hypothetical protein
MQRNREIKLALEISSIHQLSQGLSQRKMSKKKKTEKKPNTSIFQNQDKGRVGKDGTSSRSCRLACVILPGASYLKKIINEKKLKETPVNEDMNGQLNI